MEEGDEKQSSPGSVEFGVHVMEDDWTFPLRRDQHKWLEVEMQKLVKHEMVENLRDGISQPVCVSFCPCSLCQKRN